MTEESDKNNKNENSLNIRINKNVSIIGFAFMLQFTAFIGAANLQSSVNTDKSMGAIGLAVIYGSLTLSNIVLPVALMKWIGCKWTIILSFITYMPFVGVQLFPRLYTLLPAAIILGFGGGPLWCAKCTYITIITEAFSAKLNDSSIRETLLIRYFGLFFIFCNMSQIWGNLISSSVLTYGIDDVTDNVTTTVANVGEMCGAKFCPDIISIDLNSNLKPPESEKIQILSGIFLGCMCCAVLLVTFFVDSLQRYKRCDDAELSSGFNSLIDTIKQFFNRKQLLLMPITMLIGVGEAFVTADFTASFVACGWGIAYIGYAMVCMGISGAMAGGISAGLTKLIGRFPVLIVTLLIYILLLVWMKFCTVIENDYWSFCGMSTIWGFVCGTLLVQINAFYGIIFAETKEAAFCIMRLLKSIGSVIVFILNPLLCTSTKLTILLVFLIVGTFGYSLVEYLRRKEQQKNALDLSMIECTNEGCDVI